MADKPGSGWIDQWEDLKGGDSIATALVTAFLLPVVAFFMSLANVAQALLSPFIDLPNALVNGIVTFIGSLFGTGDTFGLSDLFSTAARMSGQEISIFGVFSLPAGVAIILASGAMVAYYLEQESTSDLIPFSFTDFPLLGANEEE